MPEGEQRYTGEFVVLLDREAFIPESYGRIDVPTATGCYVCLRPNGPSEFYPHSRIKTPPEWGK